jgi:8-oxo-dGTP pyrophosphatase MutT (NUDIX family)
MNIGRLLGVCTYWLAWPLYLIYFRLGERTRVVLIHDGRILAMQQWIGSGRWGLPGGGMHRGEPPLDGALRELREETGIRLAANQLTYVGKARYRQHGQRFNFHVFACVLGQPVPLRRQWHEVAVLSWLPADGLTPRIATNDTLQSLELVRTHTRLLQ